MIDNTDNPDRPHRRTALIAHELGRFDIDIAALSETRLSGEGSLTEGGKATPSSGVATLRVSHGDMEWGSLSRTAWLTE